jgi:hypothetical protein
MFSIEEQIKNSPELAAKIKEQLGSFKVSPLASLFNLLVLTDKGEYGITFIGEHEISIHYKVNDHLRRTFAYRSPHAPEADLGIIIEAIIKIEQGDVP